MTVSRRQIINTMLALPMGASLISNHALAQNKNLNMIVPYPAGGLRILWPGNFSLS